MWICGSMIKYFFIFKYYTVRYYLGMFDIEDHAQ